MLNVKTAWQRLRNNITPSPPLRMFAGQKAELAAQNYLCRAGFRPLARNFRCRYGEIDLIMGCPEHNSTLVFIEVRLRNNPKVSGAESVDTHKQRRLIRSAECYLRQRKINHSRPCRFDVVELSQCENGNFRYRRIPNAFGIE